VQGTLAVSEVASILTNSVTTIHLHDMVNEGEAYNSDLQRADPPSR